MTPIFFRDPRAVCRRWAASVTLHNENRFCFSPRLAASVFLHPPVLLARTEVWQHELQNPLSLYADRKRVIFTSTRR